MEKGSKHGYIELVTLAFIENEEHWVVRCNNCDTVSIQRETFIKNNKECPRCEEITRKRKAKRIYWRKNSVTLNQKRNERAKRQRAVG
jgi:uncharacterized paraquat-inducible protein A